MKIKFLGTAAAEGIPAFFCTCENCNKARELGATEVRTRSQTLLDNELMIDYPADTYFHSMRDDINLANIHHYLITHAHMDHFHPADVEMLGYGFANLPEDMPPYHFYGGEEMAETLAPLAQKLPKRLAVHTLYPFKAAPFGEATVIPLKATHGTKTPLIYIIEYKGKRILYALDTGLLHKETEEYLFDNKPYFDLITFDCCFGSKENIGKGNTHLCFGDIKRLVAKMRDCGMVDDNSTLCVNHFSHNAPDILYADRAVYENEGYIMTRDGLEVEF